MLVGLCCLVCLYREMFTAKSVEVWLSYRLETFDHP